MAAALKMIHAEDPKKVVLAKLKGAVASIAMLGDKVLVASYARPDRTAGGILLVDKTRDEEKYQGKTGLIVAMGPLAFVEDEDHKWAGRAPKIGDWVLFNIGDTRRLLIREADCRILADVNVHAVISDPDDIY